MLTSRVLQFRHVRLLHKEELPWTCSTVGDSGTALTTGTSERADVNFVEDFDGLGVANLEQEGAVRLPLDREPVVFFRGLP